ncbi:M15 family metallopeptidase [Plantibacter sp. YIM 135347]|uniref:M15 family metallopeptidase n=1 Tax=Plantibacter sp. YIM 135347 TaxID=3423919 RepID=UPI003D352920
MLTTSHRTPPPRITARSLRSEDPYPAARNRRRKRVRRRIVAIVGITLTALIAVAACTGGGAAIVTGISSITQGQLPGPLGGGGAADGTFGEADGAMTDNTFTAFDTDHPGIANLDPALLDAVQQATRDAAEDDITMFVSSGWRSQSYQQHLLDAAIVEYGSEEAARQYVATPDGSSHTRGAAVDIGATDADYWLIQHGTDYGLCQTYSNEIWHFELATSPGGTCPDQLPNAG